MKKLFYFILFFIPIILLAQLGPNVSQLNGKELKWEEGSRDYFVMFKSLLLNKDLSDDQPNNPQADNYVDINTGTTFTLQQNHIPQDAHVVAAYLVWTSAVDPNKLNDPTDNTAKITFTSTDGSYSFSKDIIAPSKTLNDNDGFAYEAIKESNSGLFTYRVDVTDFMEQIHKEGLSKGITMAGLQLLGKYNVSGIECSNDSVYLSTSGMVGGWALILIYTSEKITPKKIYIYNGLKKYRFEKGDITVSGFELPNEASVHLTLHTLEGDPGLFSALTPTPPEGLYMAGQGQSLDTQAAPLFNDCNPNKGQYSEIYNSISSMYGWQDTTPTCIGGNPGNPDPSLLEYAMDVDTFILDEKVFPQQLAKGNTSLSFRFSANQDQIYTNFMILSIDTKTPKFDIPNQREKNYCSCAQESDAICNDRPFYFTIKVQNWGENIAENVTVQDVLPKEVSYIAGTSEMATEFDANGNGTNWTKISDGANGIFPFSNPYKVADAMNYCNKETGECSDTILIRFKVKPVSLPKNGVVTNIATIKDSTGVSYLSNSSVPLRLHVGKCPSVAECSEPSKSTCFGDSEIECTKKSDCETGFNCVDNKCVEDTNSMTNSSKLTYFKGKNSPSNDGSPIIINNPKKDLIMGQFYILDGTASDKGKYFNLSEIKIKIDKSDSAILLSNLRLILDSNGNGKIDNNEKILSQTDKLKSNYANFIIEKSNRIMPAGIQNNFLIIADAKYNKKTIPLTNSFSAKINGAAAITAHDSGTMKIEEKLLEFSDFMFAPSNGFIVTKGEKDPSVPKASLIKGVLPIMQIKTMSSQGNEQINKLKINIKTVKGHTAVKFGKGINSISLWLDKNNDGIADQEIATSGKLTETKTYFEFNTTKYPIMKTLLNYQAKETKYLIIKCDISVPNKGVLKLGINSGGVLLSSDSIVIGLPVTSKSFIKECDPTDATCVESDDEAGGCSCSVNSFDNNFNIGNSILFLIMLFSLLFFRKKLLK